MTANHVFCHLLHEDIVEVVDSGKDVSFKFGHWRSGCCFWWSWWGSGWEWSPRSLLDISRLDQGRLEEGDVVIKAGRDTGMLQVRGGSPQVQGHWPSEHVVGGHQTLVWAQTLRLAEQLQLHLTVRAGQDLGATEVLVELFRLKLETEGGGGVEHELLGWVSLRRYRAALSWTVTV